jgi:hypothetical protein
MATKQATHFQATEPTMLRVEVCDWGGFLVMAGDRESRVFGGIAAFTSADECADWLRSYLRNQAQKKFGAKQ